jgi:hypothetical protein
LWFSNGYPISSTTSSLAGLATSPLTVNRAITLRCGFAAE